MISARAFSGFKVFRDAPLEASGLTRRILAVLRANSSEKLADLGKPVPAETKLDDDDRALLARVAAYVAGAGKEARLPPVNFKGWLALFLPPRLVDAVQLHYGLDDPAAAIALHEAKLGDTGFKLGVTRERARQLLGLADDTLRQALPLAAAEPLYGAAAEILRAAGGVLTAAVLAQNKHPAWGQASPVGACLLLAHLVPGRIAVYRGFFSAFPPNLLDRAEKALRDRLNAAPGLASIADIAAGLPKSARPPGGISAEPLTSMLLRHLPDTLATRDGRAGLAGRDGAELLGEILAATGEAPLRILVETFNQRVQPECRRGSGYVRAVLGRDPRIRKAAPGRYALPGGLQAGLTF